MIDELGPYAPFIAAAAVFIVLVATQPRYARRRAPVIAGTLVGLVLVIALDFAGRRGSTTYQAPVVLFLTAVLLFATLALPAARARLATPIILVATLALAGVVVLAAIATSLGVANGAIPSLVGLGLGLLPFALIGLFVLAFQRLRRT